jgi:hypothetical protein
MAVTQSGGSGTPEYPAAFTQAVREAAGAVGWRFQSEDPEGFEFLDADGVRQSIGLGGFFRRFRDHDPAEAGAAAAQGDHAEPARRGVAPAQPRRLLGEGRRLAPLRNRGRAAGRFGGAPAEMEDVLRSLLAES